MLKGTAHANLTRSPVVPRAPIQSQIHTEISINQLEHIWAGYLFSISAGLFRVMTNYPLPEGYHPSDPPFRRHRVLWFTLGSRDVALNVASAILIHITPLSR